MIEAEVVVEVVKRKDTIIIIQMIIRIIENPSTTKNIITIPIGETTKEDTIITIIIIENGINIKRKDIFTKFKYKILNSSLLEKIQHLTMNKI